MGMQGRTGSPAVVVWSSVALVLASLNLRRRGSVRQRAIFMGLAGAIFAIAAGPVYLGLILGAFMGCGHRPKAREHLSPSPSSAALHFAWRSAWATIELLGRANRPEDFGGEAVAGEPPTA